MNARNAIAPCRHAAEAVAWALGQLDARAQQRFEAHRAVCSSCAREAAAACRLADRLRALPEVDPSAGLTARIMAAVPSAEPAPSVSRRTRLLWRIPAVRWAAALLVLAAVLAVSRGVRPVPRGPVWEACEWIASQQEADGSWRPSRHGGADAYRPGLTALATLALAESRDARHAAAAARGAAALLDMQQPDGAFDAPGRAQLYNQALATRALFRVPAAQSGTRRAVHLAALHRAVAYICGRQSSEGGWDYEHNASGNTALTVWQVDVLAQARAAGMGDPEGNLRRGLRWLSQQATASGAFGYRPASVSPRSGTTLTAMGAWAMLDAGADFAPLAAVGDEALRRVAEAAAETHLPTDLYRDLFLVRALQAGRCETVAAGVRTRIAARRVTAGAQIGSWSPDDPWGRIGGRIYATSVAVLTLAPPAAGG